MIKEFFPLEHLMKMNKPGEVQSFLEVQEKDAYKWENIGKDETNFPRLSISRSGVKAIVERITNAIDAILENQKENMFRKDKVVPSSPREAIEKWFDVRGGHIGFLNKEKRREVAQKSIYVSLEDSGIDKKPTIIVRDTGIGIHPEEFSNSILGLGGSLKRTKPYLLGAYGWGGSQTFFWCNGANEATNIDSLPLAIIISRKNPDLLTEKQQDEVGWTIVRYQDKPNEKHGVFQYLTDKNGNIPHASPKNLPKDFTHGTQITHLAYNLESFHGRMTLVSYRLFQNLLFDPIIPFWLFDARHKEGRTISGNLSRLDTDDKGFVEYNNTQIQKMSFGDVKIRYWVLKTKDGGYHLDSYTAKQNSSESIIITLNGQQYGSINKQLIKDAGFSFLSDYILFQIECDFLSSQMKKNIFPSTREDIREQYKEQFKNEIINILQTDEELRKIEEARRKEQLTSGDEDSVKRVRRILDKLISVGKTIILGGNKGNKKKKKDIFKSKNPPTFIKILPQNKDIEFIPGEEKKIALETDASNDFLTRDKNTGDIECVIEGKELKYKIRRGFLRNGRINFYIQFDESTVLGIKGTIMVKLKVPQIALLHCTKNFEIVSLPKPLPSNYPPSFFDIANEETPLRIKRNRRSLIQINCDGPDNLLERTEDNANLSITFLPESGVRVIGRSDLVNHKIRVFLNCPEKIDIGKRFDIICRLTLSNKMDFTAQRPCVIIEPPEDSGEEGEGEIEMPNYEIVEVRPEDANWNRFEWDDKSVGIFKKSGDKLILYVSLGNESYLNTLNSNKISGDKIEAFKDRYTAYLGYHLWLLYESKTNDESIIKDELTRICQTILLGLSQDSRFH